MKSPNILTHPREARIARGETQYDFWTRFGTMPSAASCFENGEFPIRGPLRILMAAYQLRLVNDSQMDMVGMLLRERWRATPRVPLDVKAARLTKGETQTKFWARFGVGQGSASRYEQYPRNIKRSLSILLALYFLKLLGETELDAARQLAHCSLSKTSASLNPMSKVMSV